MIELPDILPLSKVEERLQLVLPEGTPNRNVCIRETASKTIFTMLYIGAIEGNWMSFGPKHVYRMTDEQALKLSESERSIFIENFNKKRNIIPGIRWYEDNSREAIRDETLKEGLIQLGLVIVDKSIPTTSSKPRYALKKSFAKLFTTEISDENFEKILPAWQQENLSRDVLARITLLMGGANALSEKVLITLPNQETRLLQPGPSSQICKAVIEVFAPMFLISPCLLWLSESGNKIVKRDDELANRLGLNIDISKHLPDIILVDLGDESNKLMITFIEAVATDGAITPARMEAFYALTDAAGYSRSQISFVTAYKDRENPGFKKTISQLAWNSFAWFVSEPDNIFILQKGAFKINTSIFPENS